MLRKVCKNVRREGRSDVDPWREKWTEQSQDRVILVGESGDALDMLRLQFLDLVRVGFLELLCEVSRFMGLSPRRLKKVVELGDLLLRKVRSRWRRGMLRGGTFGEQSSLFRFESGAALHCRLKWE